MSNLQANAIANGIGGSQGEEPEDGQFQAVQAAEGAAVNLNWAEIAALGRWPDLNRPANRENRPNAGGRLPVGIVRGISPSLLTQICLWSDSDISTSSVWNRLNLCMDSEDICKIQRVQQTNGVVRFDLWVKTHKVSLVLGKLREQRERWAWYGREHRPYNVRRERNGNLSMVERLPFNRPNDLMDGAIERIHPRRGINIGTLNIAGIKTKKTELRWLLNKHRIRCMALQETLHTPQQWAVRLPGYRWFGSHCRTDRGPSERGVAIVVSQKLSAQVVGTPNAWMVFVRIFGDELDQPHILGSVYLPCREAREAKILLRAEVANLKGKFPRDPIIMLGDYNLEKRQLLQVIREWPNAAALEILDPLSARGTRRNSSRTIDHVMTDSRERCSRPWIHRQCDISDHYPVLTRLRQGGIHPQEATRIDRKRFVLKNVDPIPIATSNRWDALIDMETELLETTIDSTSEALTETGDKLARVFIQAATKAAEDAGALKSLNTQNSTARLKPRVKRALERREAAYATATNTRPGSDASLDAWQAYITAATRSKTLIREANSDAWRKRIHKASQDMGKDPEAFWKWASRTAGWRRAKDTGGLQPVRDPRTGQLCTDEPSINEAWRAHYAELAKDVTGNSRNPERWQHWSQLPERKPLDLNAEVTMPEMLRCIKALKTHKAPGDDGIPSEFLKLASQQGNSNMAKGLLLLINWIWTTGEIPTQWENSTVVSIFKSGDVTDTGNYRGISLMSTVLKVLLTIVSKRVNQEFEINNLFSPAQAGFRTREECSTQVACLYEAAKRRQLKGKATYLTFVDLRKAYDTVPHEALFAKLSHFGVRGRSLNFIQQLYAKSKIRVRSGGSLSETVPLLRGVRQGCPLSSVLFNIFINDVLDGTEDLGCRVPGKTGDTRLPGLMFADDLVGTNGSRRKAVRLHAHLSNWAEQNEMQFGIHKCGIMVTGRAASSLTATPERWLLQGQQIPIVDCYKYLGIPFRSDLNLREMVKGRLESGRKLLHTLRPFLRCQAIPMPMRIAVVRTVLIPRLLFGSEIYGMCKAITARVQSFVNQAMRLILGISMKHGAASVALWKEFGITPICASAASRRARALQKCFQLRTSVAEVAKIGFTHRRWTWMTGTTRWLNRYVKPLTELAGGTDLPVDGWVNLEPHQISDLIKRVVWERENRVMESATGTRYIESCFSKQRATAFTGAYGTYRRDVLTGLRQIARARVGCFGTLTQRVKQQQLPATFATQCPFCNDPEQGEDLEHLLFECTRWTSLRDLHLTQLITNISLLCPPGRGWPRVALLLGGENNGVGVRNWASKPTAALPEPGHIQVALYLSEVIATRAPLLDRLLDSFGIQADDNTTEDLSPNG